MAQVKKVRMKGEPGGVFHSPKYGPLHDGNMTVELYNLLVAENPNLANVFEVKDEEYVVKEPKAPTQPKSTDNGTDQPTGKSQSRRANKQAGGEGSEGASTES